MNKLWPTSKTGPRSIAQLPVAQLPVAQFAVTVKAKRRSTRSAFAASMIAVTLLSGCYSGWNRQKQNGDPTNRQDDPPVSSSKLYGFLLLEVIHPSLQPGQNDCGNGDSPTLNSFRQHEWYEREAALVQALGPLAEHFVKNDIEISGSDCSTMQSLETRAGSASPMGSPLVPKTSDRLGRPLIHLKVILWAGAAPSLNAANLPNTFRTPWTDWRLLAYQGLVGLQTYHQFVMADQTGGVFNNWHDSLQWDQRIDGTSIQNISPTDQATADRRVTIANDTAALVQWLQNSAIGSTTIDPMGGTSRPGPNGGTSRPGPRSGSSQMPKLKSPESSTP